MTFFLILTTIVIFSGMLGVSIGYHRFLSHKSFRAQRWFEILIVFLGIPAGTPIQWAGNHRVHHRFVDTERDPHSPHHGGFWWAHCGWYIDSKNPILCFIYAIAGPFRTLFDAYHRPRSNQEYNEYAKDISGDPVFALMSRPNIYLVLVLLHTLVPFTLVFWYAGTEGLLYLYLLYLYVYNIGDGVNSLGHMWGPKENGSKHEARNNPILGFLAFGDGWHGNHHDHPAKAKHGTGLLQFDLSFFTLKCLEKIGIVRDLK